MTERPHPFDSRGRLLNRKEIEAQLDGAPAAAPEPEPKPEPAPSAGFPRVFEWTGWKCTDPDPDDRITFYGPKDWPKCAAGHNWKLADVLLDNGKHWREVTPAPASAEEGAKRPPTLADYADAWRAAPAVMEALTAELAALRTRCEAAEREVAGLRTRNLEHEENESEIVCEHIKDANGNSLMRGTPDLPKVVQALIEEIDRLTARVAELEGYCNDFDRRLTMARNALRDAGIAEVEGNSPGRSLDVAERIKKLADALKHCQNASERRKALAIRMAKKRNVTLFKLRAAEATVARLREVVEGADVVNGDNLTAVQLFGCSFAATNRQASAFFEWKRKRDAALAGTEAGKTCEQCDAQPEKGEAIDKLKAQVEFYKAELRQQKLDAWMRNDLITADRIAAMIGDELPSEHEKADLRKED